MTRISWHWLAAGIFVGLTVGAVGVPTLRAGQAPAAPRTELVGPNGPVDMKLSDPMLTGAIDVHAHLDPDSSGGGQVARAMDVIDMAKMAKARGMRGFAFKTHMDMGSAPSAYLARRKCRASRSTVDSH